MDVNIKLLTVDDITKLGLGSRTTIWRRVKEGNFPKPIRFGNAHSSPLRWRLEDIHKWINKQM
jgi:prophage regulatory protein